MLEKIRARLAVKDHKAAMTTARRILETIARLRRARSARVNKIKLMALRRDPPDGALSRKRPLPHLLPRKPRTNIQ
jgi:hypothetical protein